MLDGNDAILGVSKRQQSFPTAAIAPQSPLIAAQHAFCAGVISAAAKHVAEDTTASASAKAHVRNRVLFLIL
jgi:hypothetical protein